MNKILSSLVFKKVGLVLAAILFILMACVLVAAPRKVSVTLAENTDCSSQAASVASLNIFPVIWGTDHITSCNDFPAIAVRNINDSGYSQSATAATGDELYVRVYIHNGAMQNLDYQTTTAYGVNGSLSISGNSISMNATGSRGDGQGGFVAINSVSGSVSVNLPSGATLEMVPGSGQFFDYQANPTSGGSNGISLNGQYGSFDMGEMRACFEFSKFLRFKVRVVGGTVTPPPGASGENKLTANPNNVCLANGLVGGNVTWQNKSDVQTVEVTVQGISPVLTAASSMTGAQGFANGSSETNWLSPGETYEYVMYNTTNGQHAEIARIRQVTPNLSCGNNPPPASGSGTIRYSNIRQTSGQCLYTADISWQTSNIDSVLVTVSDPLKDSNNYYGNDKPFSFTNNDNTNASWIAAGYGYRFTLWELNPQSGGQTIAFQGGSSYKVKHLDETWVPAQAALSCGSTPLPSNPTLTCSIGNGDTISNGSTQVIYSFIAKGGTSPFSWSGGEIPSTGSTYDNQTSFNTFFNTSGDKVIRVTDKNGQNASCFAHIGASAAAQSFNLSVNPTKICVGSGATFTISNATDGLKGKQIYWTSQYTPPGYIYSIVAETNQPYNGQVVGSNGQWSQYSDPYIKAWVGHWVKTAKVDGVSKSVEFDVADCTVNPPPASQQSFNLSMSPTDFCYDQTKPSFYINNATSGLYGKNIYWSSTKNGASTGENLDYYYQNVDNGGSWSGQANNFYPQPVSSSKQDAWTKTATIYADNNFSNPVTKTVSFTVRDCGSNPPPPPVCQINSNAAINYSTPVKQGSTYYTNLSWTSTGSHNIKITQTNPGSTAEIALVTTGNSTGSLTVYNLQPGSQYVFKMYDISSCGGLLATVSLNTPANPGQLTCSVSVSPINSGQTANFTAQGGTGNLSWNGDGNPSSGSGNSFNPNYTNNGQNPVTHSVTVNSQDGQYANCSVIVNGTTVNNPNGNINLTKEVLNISNNENNYSHSTSAKQNDTVQYRIKVWAASNVTLNNVVVTDTFASGLSYIDGSLTVDGQSHQTGLSSGGLNFSSVTQNPIIIVYRAKVNVASGILTNTARATAQNAQNTATDSAQVSVSFVQSGQPSLTITKQVKNLTQNSGIGSSVNANVGDSVQYQVVIRNIGQAKASNVYFSDSNPYGVQPLTNLTVSKNYSGNISGSIALGDLNPGDTVTITYQGKVTISGGTVINVATVSADNSASQNASATVNVALPQQTSSGGNCNNGSNSCNNNPVFNNQTSSGNYSPNQNNQNTINGNNNVVTNTNNNCVNNSCNNTYTYNNSAYQPPVYINNTGNTVPYNQYSQLSITKNVRSLNGGTYQNSVTANNGDTVQFEIVVSNSGNATANNVRVSDNLPSGLSLVPGTLLVNGSYSSDSSLYNNMYLGNLNAGQQARVNFQARVNGQNGSIQNTASASSDNAGNVQASAWVFSNGSVQGGNVSLSYSKRAVNETKNADATSIPASREDYITYTLTVTNNGNTPATNFIITDDLSQVLAYADMTDNGGGQMNGNTISYPGITVPANGSVSRSFKVRVKFGLSSSLSYVMTNTYGNTITIRINPQVLGAFVAPKTGADTLAFVFSGVLTAGAAAFRRRKQILKLIFT